LYNDEYLARCQIPAQSMNMLLSRRSPIWLSTSFAENYDARGGVREMRLLSFFS
jgi:hypothetical protein